MSASGGAASAARPEGASQLSVVDFLRAALDEHERIARAATAGPWRSGDFTDLGAADVYAGAERVTVAYSEPCCSIEDAAHIALNDPAHALRTVQAHREILDLCSEVLARSSPHYTVESCDEDDAILAEQTVLSLASIYQDRPGFDPDWLRETS